MENEEKISEEEQELEDDKDLVEHTTKAVEHISSETAQEMDESSENENVKKVEAALFISARYLSLQELVMLTDINPLMIKEILEKLIEKYNDNSGIEIIEKSAGWKMDVRQEYVSMINKLATGSAEFSKAEQETLAVIAYKQPVKQSVIIKIRGNKAYDHIKNFVNINLVQAKKFGRTRELRLSDDFFEYFHLRNPEKISDDYSNSEEEEFEGMQKKGDGSTEVIGIENNDDRVSEKEVDKVEKKIKKGVEGEEPPMKFEPGLQKYTLDTEKIKEKIEKEKETDENQEGVKEIKIESESDVEFEPLSEDNSEDLEKE